jgi:Low-density lipoprotein receptor domain class A
MARARFGGVVVLLGAWIALPGCKVTLEAAVPDAGSAAASSVDCDDGTSSCHAECTQSSCSVTCSDDCTFEIKDDTRAADITCNAACSGRCDPGLATCTVECASDCAIECAADECAIACGARPASKCSDGITFVCGDEACPASEIDAAVSDATVAARDADVDAAEQCAGLLGDDGECVTREAAGECNGRSDCADGSDEAFCATCGTGGYLCDNSSCVQAAFACHGIDDCGDASDEAACASDCASGVGAADVGATAIALRLLHCRRNDGSPCAQPDSAFLDGNLPNYHVLAPGEVPPVDWKFAGTLNGARDLKLDRSPSKGPRSSFVRLAGPGAVVGCAQVRDAAFLPFQ